MGDKLAIIESKVEAGLELVDRIKTEKTVLANENDQLKIELAQIRKQFSALKLEKTDKNNAVRSRLELVLSRVDELESLAG